ncbi:MAG: right-handed parallel beta-helix repeat-containing protein [Nitrososphaera sp.]|nr:right-handed parallel beta-helix repeat-containing protein [Nitrososphaera sp.]
MAVLLSIVAAPVIEMTDKNFRAYALTDCIFLDDTVALIMTLTADCTTDESILVPDGYTLDGAGYMITAVDPVSGHFLGAVVRNGGMVAHVLNLAVATSALANVCDAGNDRLRGIMFEGASGTIIGNTVSDINQGASGCQEGNGIEVRNAPFDGTHPNTQTVEIAGNLITDYQKTGIVANGDVSVNIHNNEVGSSATQADLAANSVQLGFGAEGIVLNNSISGNQWCGPSEFVATAVLVFDADNSEISRNNIRGNSDVGIYGFGDNLEIENNRIFDDAAIADCNAFDYDIGLGNYGTGNAIQNNKVRGFDTPYDLVLDGNNKVIPDNG